MKKLNKKGFTLVELLAVVVILAVLMLAGATAIGGVMRSSKGNSLKSSLDAAMKAAETSLAQDDLGYGGNAKIVGNYTSIKTQIEDTNNYAGTSPTLSNLKDTLSYEDTQYKVAATTYSAGGNDYIMAAIMPVDGSGSFKSVRCGHGKIVETQDAITNAQLEGDGGYFCLDTTSATEKTGKPAIIVRVKKITK